MISCKTKKLKREFYTRNLLFVARELLGKILVKKSGNKILSGKIVEVEAYHGDYDQASHAYRGKTIRNEVMFNEGGYLYVYFTYGAHFCANVVVGKKGKGMAVLIRAIEPLEGIDVMIKNRFGRKLIHEKEKYNLTNGPGKLCKAFGINKNHNGTDLIESEIYILDQPKLKSKEVGVSKRIGITRSVDLQWRFFIKGNPFVSRK
jgi:DNA-3-methyladenine glycosylase